MNWLPITNNLISSMLLTTKKKNDKKHSIKDFLQHKNNYNTSLLHEVHFTILYYHLHHYWVS